MQPAVDNQQLGSQLLKLGIHRNKRRIWLDSPAHLRAAGFLPGLRYRIEYLPGIGLIALHIDPVHGTNKVSKKSKGWESLPVIDINNKRIASVFSKDVSQIDVTYYSNSIVIKGV